MTNENEVPKQGHAQNELFAALAKAQGQFVTVPATRHVIIRMKDGGSYSYNYATLAQIMDMIRRPFSENGLSIAQLIAGDVLVTILAHSSGQSISSNVPLPKVSDIKGLGANLTYLRRYSITSIAGVAIDEEDNEGADGKLEQRAKQTPKVIETIEDNPFDLRPLSQKLTDPLPKMAPTSPPSSPQGLVDAVNATLGQPYYNAPNHAYNALSTLKKNLGKFTWPGPNDVAGWQSATESALLYAREQLLVDLAVKDGE